MISPAGAARRFGIGLLLGAAAGIWYGFARPLRPRFPFFRDCLFLGGAFWIWLYFGFGVCG